MILVLARHTRPNVRPDTCYGRLDIPLAESAPQDLNASLQQIPVASRVIASPTQRCRPLAAAVADRDGLSVEEDARLLELDFGTWEGQPWLDIGPAALNTWARGIWRYAPGGGEALCELWARVDAFRQELLVGAHSCVVIISHHGPLRVLHAQCTGRSHGKIFELSFEFGGVRTLELGHRCALPCETDSL
ncbi:MAG: histidine phosphatase family protein [Steroidobacteraceae bacterium]